MGVHVQRGMFLHEPIIKMHAFPGIHRLPMLSKFSWCLRRQYSGGQANFSDPTPARPSNGLTKACSSWVFKARFIPFPFPHF